jgi:hypothetical protein
MNGKLVYSVVALLCGVIFSSCVPYDENGRPIQGQRRTNKNGTLTDPRQQEIDAKREEMRKKDEARKEAEKRARSGDLGNEDPNGNGIEKPIIDPPDKPIIDKPAPKNHPTAAAVPGKPGFVFSPFNNKVVDVKGIPSGTLVADPQYPASEKKHFRVP